MGEYLEYTDKFFFGRGLVVEFIDTKVASWITIGFNPAAARFITAGLRAAGLLTAEEAKDTVAYYIQQAKALSDIQKAAGLGNVAAKADEIEADEGPLG